MRKSRRRSRQRCAEVAEKGVTDAELKRAQQQIEVAVIAQRDGTYRVASSLGEAVASADWKWFLDYVDSIKAVTAADVQRVARDLPRSRPRDRGLVRAGSATAPPPAAPCGRARRRDAAAGTTPAAAPRDEEHGTAERAAAAPAARRLFAARTDAQGAAPTA